MAGHSGPKSETTGLVSTLNYTNTKITTGSQTIKDIINNTTLTVSNLTYEGDNKTYYFNGSSSITLPYGSHMNFNSNQTIILWLKPTDTTDARRNPYNQAYAGGGTITFELSRDFNYYWGTGGADNTPYYGFTSAFTVARNEIAQIALTRNPSTVSWYKNGVLSNSISNPYPITVTGTCPIIIGSGYAGSYIGYIYSFKVYNTTLTASQVKQNFYSLRSRFSI